MFKTVWPMGAELPSKKKLALLWDNKKYIAERKFDGIRAVMQFFKRTADSYPDIKVTTRSASKFVLGVPIDITHRVLPIIKNERWDNLPVGLTILDAEVYADGHRAEEISGILGYRSKVPIPSWLQVVFFDCLECGSRNIENLTWSQRRIFLVDMVNRVQFTTTISVSEVFRIRLKDVFEALVGEGEEGVVLKHVDGAYFQDKKPANIWVKAKKEQEYDCIITGYVEGKGKFKNLVGSVIMSQYKIGKDRTRELVEVCSSSGMEDAFRVLISNNREAYLGCVAVVGAYERTRWGKLKQPRIKYIRMEGDKAPEECIIEEAD